MIKLFPREETFIPQFVRAADIIVEAARALDALAGDFTDVSLKVARIKHLEHEGDQVAHQTFALLSRTWITPIDREDIHQLAVRLDDVIDLIDGTIRRLAIFNISEPTVAGRKLSEIIVKITLEMVEAVAALRKQKGVVEHCIRMKQFENEGDVAYQEAVGSLFRQAIEPIEVIKWKDVYENMEGCIDQAEAVAHVLESVVLKHS